MNLSIIIVSWNTKELTLNCLRSIFGFVKDIDFDVFLVDNNSSDKTVEAAEELKKENGWKNLEIIANKENLGFAKANNQILRDIITTPTRPEGFATPPSKGGDSTDDFILLLNPDTEIRGGSLEKLLDFMTADKEIGILGPKLLNSNGTLQRSCRQFPKLIDQVFVQLKFYNLFPEKIDSVREYFMLDFKHDEIKEVDQIMGAAIFIKREVLEKIGFLDEGFWAVFEEVDFCLRAKKAGFKIVFYPDFEIVHHKEQSFKQVASTRKQINFNRSLYYYFFKHKPLWQLFILWLFQPLNLFLTWVDGVLKIRKLIGKRKDL